MAKSPMDLDIGDNVEVDGKKYFRIKDLRSWYQVYNDTVGVSATISNRKIQDLDSGTDKIYFVESVEVLRDIQLTLKYRDKEMQGSDGIGVIEVLRNGLGDPFMLNKFCYNNPWYATVINNLALALTAQDLAMFRGITIYVEELSGEELNQVKASKNFTPISG